jgi:hypothetical protein
LTNKPKQDWEIPNRYIVKFKKSKVWVVVANLKYKTCLLMINYNTRKLSERGTYIGGDRGRSKRKKWLWSKPRWEYLIEEEAII